MKGPRGRAEAAFPWAVLGSEAPGYIPLEIAAPKACSDDCRVDSPICSGCRVAFKVAKSNCVLFRGEVSRGNACVKARCTAENSWVVIGFSCGWGARLTWFIRAPMVECSFLEWLPPKEMVIDGVVMSGLEREGGELIKRKLVELINSVAESWMGPIVFIS